MEIEHAHQCAKPTTSLPSLASNFLQYFRKRIQTSVRCRCDPPFIRPATAIVDAVVLKAEQHDHGDGDGDGANIQHLEQSKENSNGILFEELLCLASVSQSAASSPTADRQSALYTLPTQDIKFDRHTPLACYGMNEPWCLVHCTGADIDWLLGGCGHCASMLNSATNMRPNDATVPSR
jgi:hypothetical protein